MLKAIDVNQRIEFSSKDDKSDPKTIFVFRPLSGIEMLQFSQGSKEDIRNMLVKSLVEVKGYDHTDIEQVVDSLPLNVVGELIQKVNAINNFTGEEEKNS